VFPQEPMSAPQEFGAKALKAALGAIRVYLAGPNGAQGHLEQTAIKIDDYRLIRDDVLYNFLMTKHVLHGSEMPPKIELVQEMFNKHSNIAQHVQEKAMRMAHDISDMEMERSSICPVEGEQQKASEECCDAEPRLLGQTSTAENQIGDAQGREDQQTTSTTNEDVSYDESMPVLQLIGHIEYLRKILLL